MDWFWFGFIILVGISLGYVIMAGIGAMIDSIIN